ncbi:MAG TPA: hypothetical protein VD931_08620 [Baekduia sp.]|nr:hypothetical protein [Baekduia sp.]
MITMPHRVRTAVVAALAMGAAAAGAVPASAAYSRPSKLPGGQSACSQGDTYYMNSSGTQRFQYRSCGDRV